MATDGRSADLTSVEAGADSRSSDLHSLGLSSNRLTESTNPSANSGGEDALAGDPTSQAVARTQSWLLAQQHSSGYWCAELEGDTILESEYILLLAWLGQETSLPAQQAAKYLLQEQLPGGGWTLYPGGDVEISASVKAYFALKLTGHDPESEPLQRARSAILARGGADAVNSFTRFYLALLGQISYDHCPAVPPEMVLLPKWLPVHLYRMSAWSRTILVPLAIMWAHRPQRQLPPELGIGELMLQPPNSWQPLRAPGISDEHRWWSWERFFRWTDRGLKFLERFQIKPLRRPAIAAARRWMLDRFADSDGLGAIFPPIVWSVVALRCLGYELESREVQACLGELEALGIEEDGVLRLQPCKSPVWDTTLTMRALQAAGEPSDGVSLQRATAWLLEKEVRQPGDWQETVRNEPGGWFFEHANAFYPDLDDTAMALMVLRGQLGSETSDAQRKAVMEGENLHPTVTSTSSTKPPLEESTPTPKPGDHNQPQTEPVAVGTARADNLQAARGSVLRWDEVIEAAKRGRDWTFAMQNRDGGWGAFDKDNDAEFLCHVPFADHNAMIDPSTPDLTGRVLEGLAAWGDCIGQPAIDRAVEFLRQTQEPDGAWFGRWGVNYVYGTWQVLVGLAAVGVPASDPAVQRGAAWLLEHQQQCGGWGESPDSYADPQLRGQGPVTASQTAWAVLGLMAAQSPQTSAIQRGIQWLLDTQLPDGTWDEPEFTGTGFPQVFYLRYHYYRIYFPLLALARWKDFAPTAAGQSAAAAKSICPTHPAAESKPSDTPA